jgi:hypothetical protein
MILEELELRLVHADDTAERDEDYQCVACGYGVSGCERLPVCPMCHERAWREAACASNHRMRPGDSLAGAVAGDRAWGWADV